MAYITFQPHDYFNTLLYTDNGANRTLTGVGFQPDWVWIKTRNHGNSHNIFDAVRGANKVIRSNSTAADVTTTDTLTAFTSDGFSLGVDASGYGVNYDNKNEVAWNWRAGNSSGSSNSDGSLASTVSANTTAGFSIVKYGNTTGTQTVGHGLGSDLKVLIIKNLTSSTNWHVWHTGIPTSAIHLNETSGKTDSWFVNYQNSTAPTSSVFTVKSGNGDDVLGSSKDYIAYCFAEKKGFSKFGSYSGNGNVNGPFIYTGFKPQFVLWKRTDSSNGWIIMDTKRSPFNAVDDLVEPQGSGAEATDSSYRVDYLSNGFKIRNTNNVFNNSSGSYIYMAFAEEPLVSSNNIPATAR